MTKQITVTDRQFDWLSARARGRGTISHALDQVITLVDHHEADLEKYRKWADASKNNLQAPLSEKE